MTHDALQPQPSLVLFGLLSNVPRLYFRWDTYVKELLVEAVKYLRCLSASQFLRGIGIVVAAGDDSDKLW